MSDARPAPPTSAARSCAPCSEEGRMSRIGKKPVDLPGGVTATVSGQTVAVKGPKGTREFTATDDVTIAVEDGAVTVKPRGHLQARAPAVGHVPHPGGEPGRGRHHRLQEGDGDHRRRLPRGGAGQGAEAVARLQPRRRLRDPGRRHHHHAEADRDRRRGHRPAGRGPGRGQHPRVAQARALQGQGHPATRASSSSARKARRSRSADNGEQQTRPVPEAPPARPEQASEDGGRPPASVACIGP